MDSQDIFKPTTTKYVGQWLQVKPMQEIKWATTRSWGGANSNNANFYVYVLNVYL